MSVRTFNSKKQQLYITFPATAEYDGHRRISTRIKTSLAANILTALNYVELRLLLHSLHVGLLSCVSLERYFNYYQLQYVSYIIPLRHW